MKLRLIIRANKTCAANTDIETERYFEELIAAVSE